MEIKWSKTIKKMSHRRFKRYVDKLSKQIDEYCSSKDVKIDYVVPVLRSGAVPAVYIANQLNIVKFAPIQPKWIEVDGKRETKILLNSLKGLDTKKPLTLLVVEGTFSSGETIRVTVDEIKKTLPNAKILLACVVARNPETLPKDVEKSFYGLGLAGRKVGRLFVFPWEIKQEKEDHRDRKPENIFF
jgi:hypoxanthine phosphoribosyltransferase